ncbi:MAG: ABC transporter ATP-binding protein [Spirochaetes bacterium]|nr:ABC transporter ATP-binding protein [Spirochaetota bacterium]
MARRLLHIRDLHVRFDVYGGTLKVLNGVNLHLDEGEKVGLVGETGCGKTTTAKSILRILPMPPAKITGGEILLGKDDILKMGIRQLRELHSHGISMIFQDPTASLNPVFTIGDQLTDTIRYSTVEQKLTKRETKKRAVSALSDVSLPDPVRILENYPIQLSGGMRQRICIAMALASRSRLLIADEPTTSLDVTIQAQVLKLLGRLVEEKDTSTILITHSLGVVREWTQRVYVMYAGQMVETAPTKELFHSPFHPYTKGLMKAVPKLTGEGVALGISGRIPDYLNPPTGCRFHPRCPHVMDVCRKERPPYFVAGDTHEVACFLYREK